MVATPPPRPKKIVRGKALLSFAPFGAGPSLKLCGVVEHLGETPKSGHYTATIFTDKSRLLYHCDDNKCSCLPAFPETTGKRCYQFIYQRVADTVPQAGAGSDTGSPRQSDTSALAEPVHPRLGNNVTVDGSPGGNNGECAGSSDGDDGSRGTMRKGKGDLLEAIELEMAMEVSAKSTAAGDQEEHSSGGGGGDDGGVDDGCKGSSGSSDKEREWSSRSGKEEKEESEEGSGGQGGDGTLTSRTCSMEEIARLEANEAPSPAGWVRGLQLKDRYIFDEGIDKTSPVGSLLSYSCNERGTHSFEEEVNNKDGGVKFRVFFLGLALTVEGATSEGMKKVSLTHGTRNCKGEEVNIQRIELPKCLQRLGHGTVIVKHLIDLYRRGGAKRLVVRAWSVNGRKLYEKCGMVLERESSHLALQFVPEDLTSGRVLRSLPGRRPRGSGQHQVDDNLADG